MTARFREALHFARELRYRRPASVLVTGYRGVGKSTLMGQVFDTVKHLYAPAVVVMVSSVINGKDEELARLLVRRLQRELYMSLQKTFIGKETVFNQLPEILQAKVKRRYQETYNSFKQKDVWSWERSLERVAEFQGKGMLLTTVALVLLGSILALASLAIGKLLSFVLTLVHLIPTMIEYWKWIAASVTFLFSLGTLTLTWKRRFARSQRGEVEVSPLTDDEVTVEGLIMLLEQLSKVEVQDADEVNRLKLFFVVDEVDKLKTAQVDELLHGLKPLLFSGHAHFLFLTAMDGLYRWHSAGLQEDDIFVNLFTGHFHVLTMSRPDLYKIYQDLLRNSDALEDPLVQMFFAATALVARGRPRRFMTELLKHVRWADDQTYLDISENRIQLEFRASLYEAMEATIAMLNGSGLPPGISDVLRSVLMDLVEAMAKRWQGSFTANELITERFRSDLKSQNDGSKVEDLHRWQVETLYRRQAEKALEFLIDKLRERDLVVELVEGLSWRSPELAEEFALRVSATATAPARIETPPPADTPGLSSIGVPPGGRVRSSRDMWLRQQLPTLGIEVGPDASDEVVAEALLRTGLVAPKDARLIARSQLTNMAFDSIVARWVIPQLAHHLQADMTIRDHKAGRSSIDALLVRQNVPVALVEVFSAPEGRFVADKLRRALSRVKASLHEIARYREVEAYVVMVDIGGEYLQLPDRLINMARRENIPIPVRLVPLTGLSESEFALSVSTAGLAEPSPSPYRFEVRDGNGYVLLTLGPNTEAAYRVYRTTVVDDAPTLILEVNLHHQQVYSLVDRTVENDGVYYYELTAVVQGVESAPALAVGRPRNGAPPRDKAYWRALVEGVADTKTGRPAAHMTPRLSSVLNYLQAVVSEKAGQIKTSGEQAVEQAAEMLGLVRVGTDGIAFPTDVGKAVCEQLGKTDLPDELVEQMLYHPAIRWLLGLLRQKGTLTLGIYEYPLVQGGALPGFDVEWLKMIAQSTGAFEYDEGVFRWTVPQL